MLRMFATTGGLLFLSLLLFPLLSAVNNGDLQETATAHIHRFEDMNYLYFITSRHTGNPESGLLIKALSMCCSALARGPSVLAPGGILSLIKDPT